MIDANQRWDVDEAIERVSALARIRPVVDRGADESRTTCSATRRSREAVAPIGVATGEHCANRVIFKQLLQAGAIGFCQIDSCRLGGVNENLAVMLMAAKFGVPVCPHAGGVGLCEHRAAPVDVRLHRGHRARMDGSRHRVRRSPARALRRSRRIDRGRYMPPLSPATASRSIRSRGIVTRFLTAPSGLGVAERECQLYLPPRRSCRWFLARCLCRIRQSGRLSALTAAIYERRCAAAGRSRPPLVPPAGAAVGPRDAAREWPAGRDGVRQRQSRADPAQRKLALAGRPARARQPGGLKHLPRYGDCCSPGRRTKRIAGRQAPDGPAHGSSHTKRSGICASRSTTRTSAIIGASSISTPGSLVSAIGPVTSAFSREVFASHPDQVIVVRITADARALTFDVDGSLAGCRHQTSTAATVRT